MFFLGEPSVVRAVLRRKLLENTVFQNRDTKVGDLSGTFWSHIRRGAKKREIGFNLGIEDAWNLFIKQGQRCALSNVLITLSRHAAAGAPVWKEITASLDRKDSSKGYFLSNVQWVHKEINYIKRGLSQKEFIDWCVAVSKSQKETTNGA